jgi:hypothetical protein
VARSDPKKDGASTLAVLALGAVGDNRPLPALQPPLKEGIHLRWAFDPSLGFPWYGFYLFRRLSLTGGTAICASSQFTGLTPGAKTSPDLMIGLGQFHSDQNLVLTDDFPPTGTVEIDLSNRQFVSFQMDATAPSRRVDVSIGFMSDFPPPGGGPGTGGTGGPISGGLGGNVATVGICGCGCAHDAVRPVVERVVAIGPGQYRATFGYDNEGTASISMAVGAENRFFPDPADRGQPTLFLAGRRTDVFSVVFDGRPLTWRLAGNTVTVSAADAQGGAGGGTGGTGTDTGGSADGIVVTALRTGVPVATAVVGGRAGTVVKTSLVFDAIDEVIVSSGPARLVDICAYAVTDSLGQGWGPVPNFPQPMALPVKSPNYPISTGQPDVNASQAVALARISYAFPVSPGGTTLDLTEWSANFPQIHDLLKAIVQNGPTGTTDFVQTVTATADPDDPNEFLPVWTNQSSLGILLNGTINPAMAQILGLYWVDDTTSEGQSYDYLLVADYNNAGNGNVNTILALVTAQNYNSIEAYLKTGATRSVTAPLAPPDATTLQAYALPLASVPPTAPPDSVGLAGLTWGVPNASNQTNKISPTSAILFHAWRKDFGRAGPGQGETYDPATFTRVTDLAIAPGPPRTSDPTVSPLAGWPAVNLFDIDGPLAEGWYAYRISGIDIFGRYSALSDVAPALDIDGNVLDAQPVHIIDTTPPPPPVHVQAWLLDPQDTFLLKDTAYNTWRGQPQNSGVVGLRVRWAWGAGQRRQAPDTREFRIYLNSGTQLDTPSVATSWAQRIAIVGVGEQVVAQSLQPLQIPATTTTLAQDITGTSVSISGAEVHLQDGPALDIVLAGESELQLVVGGVASQFAVLNVDATGRIITVDQSVENIGTVTAWSLLPLRTYEVFLPGTTLATAAVFTSPAPPPRDTPVAYSLVGVSAADDKDRDDPRLKLQAPQALTPRPGNEGNVGGPSTIIQVLRTPPDPPSALFDQDSLPATKADFLSHSFITLHAVRQPSGQPAMSVHVYRALDETLFAVDALKGFPSTKRNTEVNAIGAGALGPSWTTARLSAATVQLGTPLTDSTRYATLSNDALRVLASLPSNAPAFSCITRTPLDPTKTSDIKGLSDPDTYDPNARNDLVGFTDILDGRATNVYFYKTTLVDAAQNQSDVGKSLSTPPVTLPTTAVPQAPSFATALGADRAIQLSILTVTDPTVVSYHIYRADTAQEGNDLRTMSPTVIVNDTRPLSQRATPLPVPPDTDVAAYQNYFYRVTAILPTGGESPPSAVVTARAFDASPPPDPTWQRLVWVKLDASGAEHPFTDTDPSLVGAIAIQVSYASATVARAVIQSLNGAAPRSVSPWLAPSLSAAGATITFSAYVRGLNPTIPQTIGARAFSLGGIEALSAPQTVSPP